MSQSTQSIVSSTSKQTSLSLWKDGKNGSSLQFLRSFIRLIKNHIEEGFECEDSEYKYHIGKSQYGIWLSRKKKPIFIPDPPITTTESKMTAVEDNDNGNNNTNNNGDDDKMKLEPKSAAFVSNQPSRLPSSQQQEQEQQIEQQQPLQQPQQQVYPYSVKIEQSSNGSAKVSIHTYNDDPDKARYEAIRLFIQTREDLRSKGIKVLEA